MQLVEQNIIFLAKTRPHHRKLQKVFLSMALICYSEKKRRIICGLIDYRALRGFIWVPGGKIFFLSFFLSFYIYLFSFFFFFVCLFVWGFFCLLACLLVSLRSNFVGFGLSLLNFRFQWVEYFTILRSNLTCYILGICQSTFPYSLPTRALLPSYFPAANTQFHEFYPKHETLITQTKCYDYA